MEKIYNTSDLKNPVYLEGEIKYLKHNIKLVNYYLDNPTFISELKNIKTYDELLDFSDVLHYRLKFIRKNLRLYKKERGTCEY